MTASTFTPRDHLRDQVAVITGGAGAIGLATARRMASLGARVVLVQRRPTTHVQAALDALDGEGHLALQASVTDSATLAEAALTVRARTGGASILVNCAGHTRPVPAGDLIGLSDELIDEMFAVNWRGTFAAIRAFSPQLKATGDSVVVNVSSIAAFTGMGSNLAYAAAKAATDALTKALGRTLAPQVRVLAVSPGIVDTGFVPGRDAAFNAQAGTAIPLKRVGTADDVAAAVVACCTALRYATGSVIVADGGRHLG